MLSCWNSFSLAMWIWYWQFQGKIFWVYCQFYDGKKSSFQILTTWQFFFICIMIVKTVNFKSNMHGLKSYSYHLSVRDSGKLLISLCPASLFTKWDDNRYITALLLWLTWLIEVNLYEFLMLSWLLYKKGNITWHKILFINPSLCAFFISQDQLRKHNFESYWSLYKHKLRH